MQVVLPDNATTWSLDARAITSATQVGQGTVEVLATLPLLIRPVVPRFFIAGDTVQLSAIVNNNSGKDQTATVKLDAAGITLNGAAAQQIKIANGQTLRIAWNAKVNDAIRADLTFIVIGSDGLSDASKPTLSITGDGTIPIYQFVAYNNVATSGALLQAGTQANQIYIPAGYAAAPGQVTIGLNSSLAAVSLDSLRYLRAFPHDCIEQTVSKFLPNVVTLNALKTLNVRKPELELQLTALTSAALAKLHQAQNDDGGWGWFPKMESDPLVTAYAILGSTYANPEQDLSLYRAIGWFQKQLVRPNVNTPPWELNRQAFYLYVLAYTYQSNSQRYSNNDRAWALFNLRSLFDYRAKMNLAARAFLLMAFRYTDPGDGAVKTLLDDLLTAAHRSGTMAFWKESSADVWNWGTDTRTTALVIKAILQVKPNDPILPLAVRWLVSVRQYDHWETTQETTWAIMALTDWMVSTRELDGNFDYAVKFDGTSLLTGQVIAGNVGDIKKLQIDVQKSVTDQAKSLQIERGEGSGALYYTTNLELYSSASQARAINRGVRIKREFMDNNGTIKQANIGDLITVRLTFTVEEDMYYFVLKDPYPAGIEAVDTNLRTTSLGANASSLNIIFDGKEYSGWGWWYIDRVELRDQQMNLYADYLPEGTYTFTYQVRATFPGVFQVMPAHAYPFYQPDQFGRSEGATLTISDTK